MSNKKSLEDRIHAIQNYCVDCHIDLELIFESGSSLWRAWDDAEQLTDGCDSFEELVEALEAHFEF